MFVFFLLQYPKLVFSGLKSSVTDPDPHEYMPPGSGSTWTDADLDPGGKKSLKNIQVH